MAPGNRRALTLYLDQYADPPVNGQVGLSRDEWPRIGQTGHAADTFRGDPGGFEDAPGLVCPV
jgi:hypothetical protein